MSTQPNKQPDLIFDVGLHRGEDTEFYLKKGFRVVAFEANGELVDYCKQKFASAIAENRLTIVEGAIVEFPESGPAPSSVVFYKNLGRSVWGTAVASWAERNADLGMASEKVEVPAVNFVDALGRHGIPYYLKIDIEGCDNVCLAALKQFDCRPDFVSLESDKTSLPKLENELNVLDALGYRHFAVVQQGNIKGSNAPQPPKEGAAAEHTFAAGASGPFGRELRQCWYSKQQALSRYKAIFFAYRLFGDGSWFGKNPFGRKLLRMVERLVRRRIPGWYDTHAALEVPLSNAAETTCIRSP